MVERVDILWDRLNERMVGRGGSLDSCEGDHWMVGKVVKLWDGWGRNRMEGGRGRIIG